MRFLITTICLILIGIVSNGQSESGRIFKPFRVDIGMGFALPIGGSGEQHGFLIAVEPKYAFTDKFALGLRFEAPWLVREIETSTGKSIEGAVQFQTSFTLTGDYYFKTNKLRPFIGGGMGDFGVANMSFGNVVDKYDESFTLIFGYMLRAGFDARHFRVGLEYNGVGSTETKHHNNYIGFKLSGFFGGGRIKK